MRYVHVLRRKEDNVGQKAMGIEGQGQMRRRKPKERLLNSARGES